MPSSTVTHKNCGKPSNIGRQIANVHRANPNLLVNFFCQHCKRQCPVGEFELVEPQALASETPAKERPAPEASSAPHASTNAA